jgi:hypothetical protein
MKTKNPSACNSNCIACSPESYEWGVNKSNHPVQKPSYKPRANPYTWQYDSILVLSASSYPVASNLLANWVINLLTNKQTS